HPYINKLKIPLKLLKDVFLIIKINKAIKIPLIKPLEPLVIIKTKKSIHVKANIALFILIFEK
ncbi:hypothetical protein CHH91_18020, partial [Virgibacillus sp. 7505]|uniref:hypothetical protein n=1 Tax=Virgibacillus sp. 7505 TaxID=2022548 RepID=UPI000BC72D5C